MTSPPAPSSDKTIRLGYGFNFPLTDEGRTYLHNINQLLGSSLHLPQGNGRYSPTEQTAHSRGDADLFLYWESNRQWWQQWWGVTSALHVMEKTFPSVLVIRQPCWPIRRILLILRGDKTDESSIQWLERFARPAQADVFILPIIPPVPAMYHRDSIYNNILSQAEILVAEDTHSGAYLRQLASLCESWGIQNTLLLHDGGPQRRIDWAATTTECDLIILSDESNSQIERWFFGELVRPLLRWANRSVLVARAIPDMRR